MKDKSTQKLILNIVEKEIKKNEKKKIEYLEVGNKSANTYEFKEHLYNTMYNLIMYAIEKLDKEDK